MYEKLFIGASLKSPVEVVTAAKAGGALAKEASATERLEVRAALYELPPDEDGSSMLVCAERTYLVNNKTGAIVKRAAGVVSSLLPQNPLDELDQAGGELVFSTVMTADHVTVKFKKGINPNPGYQLDGVTLGKVITPGHYIASVNAESPTQIYQTLNTLRAEAGVEYANPDFLFTSLQTQDTETPIGQSLLNSLLMTVPNDANYSSQWNLPKVDAPDAWSISTGGTSIVAVFDIGIKTTHPDLSGNLDTHGWNWVNNTSNVTDSNGHGTHVSGIIGASGNNSIGVCGVCWNIKIMPLVVMKVVGGVPTGVYSAAEQAADYLYGLINSLGIRVPVANHSWGGTSYDQGVFNSINNSYASGDPLPTANAISATWTSGSRILTLTGTSAELAKVRQAMTVIKSGSLPAGTVVLTKDVDALGNTFIILSALPSVSSGTNVPLTWSNPLRGLPYGTMHVAAAGSSSANADQHPIFPASFPSDFVISVGGSDKGTSGTELPTTDSNYGQYLVDLFAPGTDIWSTNLSPAYKSLNGSSYAAPIVSGALALYFTIHPTNTEAQGRAALLYYGIDASGGFLTKCYSQGRLNINGLLTAP